MGHHDIDFESAFVDGFDDLPETIDEAAVERIRAVAKLFDEQVTVPGTDYRIGIDPLVSAVPVAGDVVGAAVSLYVVAEAAYLGVSLSTVVRMLANVAVDVAGGAVPYVGVLFDAVWKTNKRNLELALDDLLEAGEDDQEGHAEAGPEHETEGLAEHDREPTTNDTEDASDGPVVIEVE